MLPPIRSEQPTSALDSALTGTGQRYGPATSDWVARLVEYPGHIQQ